jgi:hypothetical protein
MALYSFRAECISDVCSYLGLVGGSFRIEECSTKQDPIFPDVDVRLCVEVGLAELRRLARRVEDGHVIVESLVAG